MAVGPRGNAMDGHEFEIGLVYSFIGNIKRKRRWCPPSSRSGIGGWSGGEPYDPWRRFYYSLLGLAFSTILAMVGRRRVGSVVLIEQVRAKCGMEFTWAGSRIGVVNHEWSGDSAGISSPGAFHIVGTLLRLTSTDRTLRTSTGQQRDPLS